MNVLPRPAMTEAELQASVIELARIFHWEHLHVRRSLGRRDGGRAWQTTTNLKGWVDLLLWKPGQVIAAELKSDRGKTTPEQDAVLASLAAAGIETHVWRPADLEAIAKRLSSRERPSESCDWCGTYIAPMSGIYDEGWWCSQACIDLADAPLPHEAASPPVAPRVVP